MRALLLLWCVGVAFADIMPPVPPGDTPPAQPVPDDGAEEERPLPPPARPAVMPEQVLGCAGYGPLTLGSLLLLGVAATQRGRPRVAGH